MLSNVALRSIADNLAALRLDPVQHLKIIAAVVAPLMRGEADSARSTPLTPAKPRSPKAGKARKRGYGKSKEPIPIAYDGQTFPSRGAMAKHLSSILGKSVPTLSRALMEAGDDAEAVARRYRPEEPRPEETVTFRRGKNAEASEADFDERPAVKRPSAPSPEGRAKQWLEERLERGPVDVVDFEAAVARHEFDVRSAEQAKVKLGLVARAIRWRDHRLHAKDPVRLAAAYAETFVSLRNDIGARRGSPKSKGRPSPAADQHIYRC
jgi:hypothetical protein